MGDALLAHELAHTAQQRDAARDPQARKRAIGSEDTDAEHDADRAAAQGLAGSGQDPALAGLAAIGDRFGDVMRTGLQLQRCSEQQAQTKGNPSDLAKQYGLTLTTSPNVDEGGSPAVVGGRVTFVLNANLATMQAAGRKVSVNGWDLAGPDGGHFTTSFVNKPETTLPIVKPGRHVFTATLRIDDNIEFPISTTFSAVTPGDRAQTLLADEHAPKLGDYKSSLMFTQALLAPAPAAEQGASDFRIDTGGDNPATLSTDKHVTYTLIDRFKEGTSRRWFARPLSWAGMPEVLGEHVRTTMADGLSGYDLGHSASASLPTSHKGTFAVVCQTLDAQGNTLHDARYLQAILTKDEAKSAKELGTFIDRVENMDDRFDGEVVPISAMHVTTITSAAMPLRLYVGKKKGEPNTWLLQDLTAGVDPKRNQLAYTGSTVAAVLSQFRDHNKYPTGAIAWRIDDHNKLGVPARDEQFNTDGESTLEKLSSWSGIASLLLMGAAIAAAPFTGGGSLLVTSLIIGSAAFGVAAGALSLADHLQNEKISATSVAIDSAQIVASMLNAGAALKAARSGAAMLVASRGGRFLLWSAFAADGVSGLLITAEGIEQISTIVDNESLPADAKASAILRVVTNLVLTGALLALSYGDLRATQARLTKQIGPGAGHLPHTDQLTLGLLEDATLAQLKGATPPDLERLVAMVKGDPSSIARLVAQPGLLSALKRTSGTTMRHLELELLRDRLTKLGLAESLALRAHGAFAATDLTGAQLHIIDDASLRSLQAIDIDLAAGKLHEARTAFAAMHVPGTARRELEIAMAKAHGLPDLGSHTVSDTTLAKKLFTSLEARGIDIAVFRAHPMDDLVAKKVNTALTSDPLMPSKSTPEIDAARGRAEQWALTGANGDPSEFANRYEYARAKFGNAADAKEDALLPNEVPKGTKKKTYAQNSIAPELTESALQSSLERDVAAIQKLPPGQNRVERLPSDTPESITSKVQQLDRIAYQSRSAEAYHVEKHARELDGIVGLPENDQVARFAEATRLTLREGLVHAVSLESNGSFKVIFVRKFSTAKTDAPKILEAVVYVQTDGTVVMATFGGAKASK